MPLKLREADQMLSVDCKHGPEGCLMGCKGEPHDKSFKPKETAACGHVSLEYIKWNGSGALCETCFKAIVIAPLMSQRRIALAAVSAIDNQLTTALEKLSATKHHDTDSHIFTCACGEVCKSGLAYANHLPDCKGETKPQTKRQQFANKVRDDIIQEIG